MINCVSSKDNSRRNKNKLHSDKFNSKSKYKTCKISISNSKKIMTEQSLQIKLYSKNTEVRETEEYQQREMQLMPKESNGLN